MKTFILGLSFGLVVTSCAGIIIPKLQDRSLFIHHTGKLYYPHCVKKSFFGNCKKWRDEMFDISKPEIQAILEGFVCKRRTRQY